MQKQSCFSPQHFSILLGKFCKMPQLNLEVNQNTNWMLISVPINFMTYLCVNRLTIITFLIFRVCIQINICYVFFLE